jgi:hypothetical protein
MPVVLVEASGHHLAEGPLGVGPGQGFRFVEVASQHQIDLLGKPPADFRGVGQILERVVNQRQTETVQRFPGGIAGQPHHLLVGEPQMAGVVVVPA